MGMLWPFHHFGIFLAIFLFHDFSTFEGHCVYKQKYTFFSFFFLLLIYLYIIVTQIKRNPFKKNVEESTCPAGLSDGQSFEFMIHLEI